MLKTVVLLNIFVETDTFFFFTIIYKYLLYWSTVNLGNFLILIFINQQ